MDSQLKRDIQTRLKNDMNFNWGGRNETTLYGGTCPSCGQKECFVSLENPWRVACNRTNNCGWTETTKELYPEAFGSFSTLYPKTNDDLNATAKAYLAYNRQFDIDKIKGWFYQSEYITDSRKVCPTVCFELENGAKFHRFIDDIDAVENKKTRIIKSADGKGYKGEAWYPPKFNVENGDTIFVTEGIFKAIAFFQIGYKAIAAMSSKNIPIHFFEKHKGKGVKWVVALDSDVTGREWTHRFIDILKELKEDYAVLLPPEGRDWDDLFRINKLNKDLFNKYAWNGLFEVADTLFFKAFLLWKKQKNSHLVLNMYHRTYQCKVRKEVTDNEYIELFNDIDFLESIKKYVSLFSRVVDIKQISNFDINYLYNEELLYTEEQMYCFQIRAIKNKKLQQTFCTMSADLIFSAKDFAKKILGTAPESKFDGSDCDLKEMSSEWFNRTFSRSVTNVPFYGYIPELGVYVYKQFAYYKGAKYTLNPHNYFEVCEMNLKSHFEKSKKKDDADALVRLFKNTEKTFDSSWFKDFELAYCNNGLILLSWWLGSLFSVQMRKRIGRWPFLEYTGTASSGKSTQIEFCWKLLGCDGVEGFDPNATGNTKAGLARAFQQVSNAPIVLIEGDSETGERKGFNYDELKKAYNGRAIRTIATKNSGAETIDPPFLGSICVSQNKDVSGSPAFLSRFIKCHVTTSHHTPEGRAASIRINSIDIKTLGTFIQQALKNEELFLTQWDKHFKDLFEKWVKKMPQINNRIIENHAQVGAWVINLQTMLGEELFGNQRRDSILEQLERGCYERQATTQEDNPIVEKFWTLYEAFNYTTNEYGAMVERLNHSNKPEIVAVHLATCLEVFAEHKQDRIDIIELQKALPESTKYRFIAQMKVNRKKQRIHCWAFKKPKQKENVRHIDDHNE